MINLEKVIKALTICSKTGWCENNTDCPYFDSEKESHFEDCKQMLKDALELLKEQKGVPYVFNADGETVCGVCGYHFDKAYSNCPKCGKKVDWNG